MHLTLDLLGRLVVVRAEEERVHELLERLFQPFELSRELPDAKPSKTVSIYEAGAQWLVDIDGTLYGEPGDIWGALINTRNAVVEAGLKDRDDIVTLHAATVVRGGRALLLAGDPWAGKTTFSLRLLEEGWEHFSDDAAPIELATGLVVAFPKPPAIRTRPWGDLKHLWEPTPAWLPEPDGYYIVPTARLPRGNKKKAEPAGLIHLVYKEGTPASMDPLSPALAVTKCAPGARALTESQFARLVTVCRGMPSVELRYSDVGEALPLLRKYLADIFPPGYPESAS